MKVDVEIAQPTITLDIHICSERRGYRVTWEGEDLENRVIAWLDERRSTHAFEVVEEIGFNGWIFPTLGEYLFPHCEHGLSLSLCAGPDHYPPDNYYW